MFRRRRSVRSQRKGAITFSEIGNVHLVARKLEQQIKSQNCVRSTLVAIAQSGSGHAVCGR